MTEVSRYRKWWIVLAVLVVLCLLPLWLKGYFLHIAIMCLLNSLFALTWLLVLRAGQLSLGHMGFMVIGAYTSVILVEKVGLPFWPSWIAAGLLAAIFGLVIGMITLRLKGLYFAVITFGVAMVLQYVPRLWKSVLGGVHGFADIGRPEGFWGIEFTVVAKEPYFYFILGLLVVAIILFSRMDRSRIGRIARGISASERLSESIGVNCMRYKVLLFTISSLFVGLGGSFLTHYVACLEPGMFSFWDSAYPLIWCIVGGTGFMIAGPLTGTILLTIVPEFFRELYMYQGIIYGALTLVIIIFIPQGLMSQIIKIRLPKTRSKKE